MQISNIINLLSGNISLIAVLTLVFGGVWYFMKRVGFYEYKRWREAANSEQNEEATEWYKDTRTRARHVQRFWESKYLEPLENGDAFTHDEVKGEMRLAADQLDRLASKADEDKVAPTVVTLVRQTSTKCRVGNTWVGMASNSHFRERGEEAVAAAETLEDAANENL